MIQMFKLDERKTQTFDQLWDEMAAVLGRSTRPLERGRAQRLALHATKGWRQFSIEIEQPADVAINLATMMEYGLCGGSRSDTESAVHTTPSSSQPPIPEPILPDPTPSDPSTNTETFAGLETLVAQYTTNYIVNSSSSISMDQLSNSVYSAITYSGSWSPIHVGTPGDVEVTLPSTSNP